MTLRPAGARRQVAPIRRTRPIRRASAGISPIRAAAALVVVLVGIALYGAVASPVFSLDRIEVGGIRFTPDAAVRERLAVASGTNLFTLATEPLEAGVLTLPAVAGAEISVGLPDRLIVAVTEREPILVWRVGSEGYLVDVDGRLFHELAPAEAVLAEGLAVLVDERDASAELEVGVTLDPVDLDAARRLGSLTPAEVGSAAPALRVSVTDEHGFIVSPGSDSWSAIFGFYTPSLRTTQLIPGQVRLLRSLLVGRESTIDRIVLASDTDGTYIPKRTPRPEETDEP